MLERKKMFYLLRKEKGCPNLLFEMKRLFCENPVWSNAVRLAACLVVLHR